MSQNDRRMAFVMPIFTHDGVGPAFNAADPEAALSVIERFRGACLAGLNGEMAIDAAMGAVQLKHGETPPPLTGVQLISEARFERQGADRSVNFKQSLYAYLDGGSLSAEDLVTIGELCAHEIDTLQELQAQREADEEPPRLDDAHG